MKFVSSIMAVMLAAGISMGATFRSLPNESKADFGATHVATITYADLASATNLAAGTYVVSNICPVAAKQSVEMVAMVLVSGFYDTATNGHSSTAVTVGDSTSATTFMTSTELNTNGTAVYIKYGTSPLAVTSAIQTNVTAISKTTANVGTNITATMGNVGVSLTLATTNCWVNGGTNEVAVVTNVTLNVASIGTNWTLNTSAAVTNVTITSETQTRLTGITDLNNNTGTKVYTSANDLKFTFTGTSGWAMQDLDAGEVRFYFRLKDAAILNP